VTKKRWLSILKELHRGLGDSATTAIGELETLIKAMPEQEKSGAHTQELIVPKELQAALKGYALFSDGACRGNPGPGAWGMLGQDHQGVVLFEASGVEMSTTNNRMELMGAIEALKNLLDYFLEKKLKAIEMDVYLYSDSRYVLDGLSSWIEGWKARGWKKADKKTPENLELWKELDLLRLKLPKLQMIWVKGHSGHPQNEKCDWLANQALDEAGL
jgi:ribonuclease HI